jgi:hypothetical protein
MSTEQTVLSEKQRELAARRHKGGHGKRRGVSPAMRVVAARMTDEERATLEAMAEECHVSLSWAVREGARLVLEQELNRLRSVQPAGDQLGLSV